MLARYAEPGGATLASVVQGPVVRLLHIITALGGFAGFLKGEWLTLPVGLFHILSLFYRRRSPSSKLASTITVVGWMYRTLMGLFWGTGVLTMTPAAIQIWRGNVYYITEALICLTEQLNGLMVLPAPVVAALEACHLAAIYNFLHYHQLHVAPDVHLLPSLASFIPYALLSVALPHLFLLYMSRPTSAMMGRSGASAGQPTAAKGIGQSLAKRGEGATASFAPGEDSLARLKAKQQEAEKDWEQVSVGRQQQEQGTSQHAEASGAFALAHSSTPSSSTRPGRGHEGGHPSQHHVNQAPTQQQASDEQPALNGSSQRSTDDGAVPSTQVLQNDADPQPVQPRRVPQHPVASRAVGRARRLAPQGLPPRAYASCLSRSKLALKLNQQEPEQLSLDVVSSVTEALRVSGHSGVYVGGACVRRGCVLILLDMINRGSEAAGAADKVAGLQSLDAATSQHLLASLLAPGTRIPDKASAHILVGDQQVDAHWEQSMRTWQVETTASAGGKGKWALLTMDNPLAVLPSSKRHHRVSLLLRTTGAASFVAPDPGSATPALPEGGAPETKGPVIQCVARGPWGAGLPVAVVGWEAEPDEQQHQQESEAPPGHQPTEGTKTCVVALTLDVDLATAPGPGAVQLELWHGLNILASAPLLLLPPQPQEHSTLLMEELGQHVEQCSWEVDAAESVSEVTAGTQIASASGVPALLSDLGQVLFTADCISNPGRASGLPLEGPGAWGGVAAGIMAQHTGNPECLDSTLQVAEGLVEYAQAQGLPHLASTVQDAYQLIEKHRSTCTHSGAVSAACDKSLGKPAQQQQQEHEQGSEQAIRQQPPSLQQCMRAVLLGFPPDQEEQYGVWMAARYALIRDTWRATFLVLIASGLLRSLLTAAAEAPAPLTVSALLALPYSVGLILSRWQGVNRGQEVVGVCHAAMRAALTFAWSRGLLGAYPSSYTSMYRTGMHLVAEVLLQGPAEPMRLLPLLLTRALLLAGGLERARMFHLTGLKWGIHAVAPHVCVLAMGLVMDLRRRTTFLTTQPAPRATPQPDVTPPRGRLLNKKAV